MVITVGSDSLKIRYLPIAVDWMKAGRSVVAFQRNPYALDRKHCALVIVLVPRSRVRSDATVTCTRHRGDRRSRDRDSDPSARMFMPCEIRQQAGAQPLVPPIRGIGGPNQVAPNTSVTVKDLLPENGVILYM